MKKRYKYKLRPGAQAEALLKRHAGTCRWVWNQCVDRFNDKDDTSQNALIKNLTALRKEHEWLREQPLVPQQQAIRDFIAAKNAFFKKIRKRPKIKSKYRSLPSLNYTRNGFGITKDGRLRLAGGIFIPVVWSRELPTSPTSVRVYQDSVGTWWASFVVDVDTEIKPRENNGDIGVDWGVKTPATTTNSDFDLKYSPRVRESSEKLAKLQRRMALHRKNKEWSLYKKAKRKAAKLHRKLRNQRREQSRKWSQNIAKNHANIAVEDFKPKFLSQNKRLAKKASENAIALVKSELEAATQSYGSNLILIDPRYTTMDCSFCGTRPTVKIELHVRTYQCDQCGIKIDRDLNAAKNMLIRAGFNPAGNNDYKTPALDGPGLV